MDNVTVLVTWTRECERGEINIVKDRKRDADGCKRIERRVKEKERVNVTRSCHVSS